MNTTNNTIKAKDAVPGQRYLVGNKVMIFVLIKGKNAFYVDEDVDVRQRSIEEQITPLPDCTGWDWEPTPKHPPIPEGWRLIDKEKDGPKRAGDKVYCIDREKWISPAIPNAGFDPELTYIRRIAPHYRPFANAEEFDPFSDRIVVNIGTGTRRRIDNYSDTHVNGMTWDMAFRKYKFLDSTPFGVKINDEHRENAQGG